MVLLVKNVTFEFFVFVFRFLFFFCLNNFPVPQEMMFQRFFYNPYTNHLFDSIYLEIFIYACVIFCGPSLPISLPTRMVGTSNTTMVWLNLLFRLLNLLDFGIFSVLC